MSITLYFLSGFNNYYNRTIKMPEETNVSAYQDYIVKIDEVEKFDPNDGVMSKLTVNYWDENYDLNDGVDLDYLLVCEYGSTFITSKWFILDRKRKAEQKWEITIRRDLVADNYERVIGAPCFIEKATLPADSPFIFNNEDFMVNQIKQEETLLKDKSGCPWIVGYIAEKNDNLEDVGELSASFNYDAFADITLTSLSDWDYSTSLTYGAYRVLYSRIYYHTVNGNEDPLYSTTVAGSVNGYFNILEDGTVYTVKTDKGSYSSYLRDDYSADAVFTQKVKDANWRADYYSSIRQDLASYMSGITIVNRFDIQSLNGKVIHTTSNNKFYRISVKSELKSQVIDIKSGSIFNTLSNFVKASGILKNDPNGYSFKQDVRYQEFKITLTEVSSASGTITLPVGRYKTNDSTYDMFCMPYADVAIYANGDEKYIQKKDISLAAATGLARQYYGAGVVYDLQLVPFCPAPYILDEEGNIDVGSYVIGTINYGETEHGVVIFPTDTQLSFNIEFVVDQESSAIEKKIKNQCEFYRLCSPNYNGVFEFNPQKNNGMTEFNVDITYKPYSPYIHVNPNFDGLYGQDFDDSRGLICGGDFSLPINTDAWATYELQNKNYQKQFDRQIENMENTRNVSRISEIAGIATGAFSGGVGLGATALSLGGPIAGGVAAAGGAVISAVGGAIDYGVSEKLHSMSIDYTKDMFRYNNENIKALPYSLAKTTAYTNNNKIFPFVERYDATEEEKEALRNKLKYNGMSVGVIGKIADYQQGTPSYIKGSIIRIENATTLDYHSLAELSNEIYKGVFI